MLTGGIGADHRSSVRITNGKQCPDHSRWLLLGPLTARFPRSCYSTMNHSGRKRPPDGIDIYREDRPQQMERSSRDSKVYETESGREEQMESQAAESKRIF